MAGGLWILGGVLEPDRRLVVWGAALAVDLLAPIIGYPTPRLGRSRTADYDIVEVVASGDGFRRLQSDCARSLVGPPSQDQ